MKRIIVIGSSGAGKSTFARRLGKATGIEVIHLDKLHWKPNWVEPSKDDWRAILAKVIKGDSWILDGNYSSTLEMRLAACDTAIFLDFPKYLCVYRILKRWISYRNENRPDMAEGCYEKFDWEFIKWVWNFPSRSKPRVEQLLKRFEIEKNIIDLKSKSEIEIFLSSLEN